MTTVDDAASVDAGQRPMAATRFATGLIGLLAVGVALLSALTTFLVLAGLTPIAPSHYVVITLLGVNTATVLLLLAIIGREVWHIVQARRRGRAAARLHVQIVGLFSVIAAAPAVLVAVVASITLDRGLDQLFSVRTRAVIENSLIVADAYLNEHAESVRADTSAMAIDVGRAKPLFDQDRDRFRQFFTAQASLRGLPTAMILGADRSVIVKADISVPPEVGAPAPPPAGRLSRVTENEPEVGFLPDASYIGGLIKLRGYDNAYLYVARYIDPQVLAQIRETQTSIAEYANLESRRLGVQIAFALMYTVIALIVLLSAVWIGFAFANRLVAPIRRLIGAANIVSTGNLHVQVPVRRSEGDLAQLGETFNKMTQELRTQRDDIVRARDQIDSRRRFTEAVLSGASAGVIGIDAKGCISILNRSAEKLIGCSEADALQHPLEDVVPELKELIGPARTAGQRLVQGTTTISRNGRDRTVSVRVTTEQTADPDHGYVITLDDITDLVVAQRTAAWADIARRIAHEIKNPLTPIQLSAERIKRKYGSQIQTDRETFDKLTDTISRQVGDIKSMVDEFASFARVPQPKMESGDLREAVQEPVILFRESHTGIAFDLHMSSSPVPGFTDRRLLSQAVTNLVKNATEAIDALSTSPDKPEDYRGRIEVRLERLSDRAVIEVIDNGIGLPKQNRTKLLEPYVTTRAKGTGLGLAIVHKIVEQHKGTIELDDAPAAADRPRGARVRICLPMPLLEQHPDVQALVATTEPASAAPVQIAPAASVISSTQMEPAAPLPPAASSTPPAVPKSPPAPAVTPRLLKNSDRVRPVTPGRTQGAR